MYQGFVPKVDYPPSEAGSGKEVYIKTLNTNTKAIIYYYGDFDLANITPATFKRMLKTSKRRLFYFSHY